MTRAGEDVTARPAQTTGFVGRGRCETCGWPHHHREVRHEGWFRNRVAVFLDRCGNCQQTVEVWRG